MTKVLNKEVRLTKKKLDRTYAKRNRTYTRNQRNYIGRFYELVTIKYTYPGYVIRSGYTSDELRDCL